MTTNDMKFTPAQIRDWKAYERVRKSGHYNMYDPRARLETGLSGERYSFVMQNFSKLEEECLKLDGPAESK